MILVVLHKNYVDKDVFKKIFNCIIDKNKKVIDNDFYLPSDRCYPYIKVIRSRLIWHDVPSMKGGG